MLTPVFADGYFDLDYSNPKCREGIESQIKIAWGSSPLALCSMLERVVDTPGGNKQFDFAKNQTSEFAFSKLERQNVLIPIIEKLNQLTLEQDLKLLALVRLLELHCKTEKVIVFCERHAGCCRDTVIRCQTSDNQCFNILLVEAFFQVCTDKGTINILLNDWFTDNLLQNLF